MTMPSCETLDLSCEPLATSQLTDEQKERLTEILDRYLSSLESGTPLDSEVLLDEHPDLADHLRVYLGSLDELHFAAAGFANRDVANSTELDRQDDDTKRLGDFMLERELGRGGMGIVYEAIQISLDRKVALKVLPFAAVLDSTQIARFKTEAQAAAQILHPNIVPVFAVGVDRGVHFYAMRLIDGQPLDQAIGELGVTRRDAPSDHTARTQGDEVRAERESVHFLDTPTNDARWFQGDPTHESQLKSQPYGSREYFQTIAGLGVQAAEALHAAHEHGIVHRDVKPSNLLLDHDGKLWVTDFGLARCQRDAGLSRTGDIVGTMRYMSPEQASGKTSLVDHRTDIYSLGVTLYELLTLKPAVQGEDGPKLLHCITDESPLTPRKLHPQIPVALQNVVLKAMAKNREDRYGTTKELADDLHRFLDGKPTIAKPPTVVDRMTKWCMRHRGIVATAVCVTLLASLGFALSTVLIAREKANTQRNFERAEENFREAQEAVDRFGAQYAERLASVPGAAGVRREMLVDTLGYYQRFAQQAGNAPSLQADLAITHSKMGKLSDEIGAIEEAIASYEKALVIFDELSASEPHVIDHQRRLALCQNNLAMALRRAGRIDDAKSSYLETVRLQRRLTRQTHDERLIGDLAVSQTNLGLLLSEIGRKEEAERSFREAIRLQEQLVASSPNDAERHRNLAATFNNLSTIYIDSQPEEAIACYESALSHQEIAAASEPANASYKSLLAATYNNLGSLQVKQSKFVAAAASYEQAIEFQRELLKPDPAHWLYRQDLAVTYNNYGLVLSRLRRTSDAKRAFQQSLAIQETLVALNPDAIALRSSFGSVYNNLGIAFEEQRDFDQAATAYEDAVRQQRLAFLRASSVTQYRVFLSKHYFNLGRVLRRLGRPDRAAQIALARRELWPNDGERLFSVAKELALASRDWRDSEASGELTAEQTASLAIDTLEQAANAGFQLPRDLAANEAFAPLNDNSRFLKLVGG